MMSLKEKYALFRAFCFVLVLSSVQAAAFAQETKSGNRLPVISGQPLTGAAANGYMVHKAMCDFSLRLDAT